MSKTMKVMVITLLLVVSLALSFGAGCALDTTATSESDLGLDVVEEAWNIIFKDYVDKDKLDAEKLSQAAIPVSTVFAARAARGTEARKAAAPKLRIKTTYIIMI